MRYLAVTLSAVLAVALVVPAFAQPFSDVPTNHWAYDAISELAAKGIVEGFPDGTFRGDRAMTRFEMAIIVARLLARIESIQVPAPIAAPQQPQITSGDIQTIQRLVGEFRGELASLGVRVTAIEEELNAIKARLDNVRIIGGIRFRYDDTRKAPPPPGLPIFPFIPPGLNGNPRTGTTDASSVGQVPLWRAVAKIEFDGSVAPDVHLITAILTGSGKPATNGYFVFNSSAFGLPTAANFSSIDNLFFDWRSPYGWPLDIWLGRFGGSNQVSYGSHPVQFGPFGLLMNTATFVWQDATGDSGFNAVDGLRIAGHWADFADMQIQGLIARITGGTSGSNFVSGEDAYGVDANVRVLPGLRAGAYYVGNSIQPGTVQPTGAVSSLYHLYGPGSGTQLGALNPNCFAVSPTPPATVPPTGITCPALGNGAGAYADWAIVPWATFDGEYAQWNDSVNGISDNGWEVNFNVDLGTLTGWGHKWSLSAGYLDFGANFYPPYGNTEADLGFADALYPGNEQGLVGQMSFEMYPGLSLYGWLFSGNTVGGVAVGQGLTEYEAGIRYLFAPRSLITVKVRELRITGVEQLLLYRAQLDYTF